MEIRNGKYNDFIGNQTLILGDDYIEDNNSNISTRINYSTIEKIYFDFDCFFIYIGAIKAILVPVSTFSNDAHKEEFLNLLKHKTGLDVSVPKKRKFKL